MKTLVACETCGLVQEAPEMPPESAAHCARCGFKLFHRRANSRWQTFALSLAAAILYVPSNVYPLVSGSYLGNHALLRAPTPPSPRAPMAAEKADNRSVFP